MDKVKFLNLAHTFSALAYRLGKVLEKYKDKNEAFDISLDSVLLCLDELANDSFDMQSIELLKGFFIEHFSDYIGIDVLSYLLDQVLYLIFYAYRNGVNEKVVQDALCNIANEYQLEVDDTYAWLFIESCVWSGLNRKMFFDKGLVENLPIFHWCVRE